MKPTARERQKQLEILQDGIRIDASLVAQFFDVQTPLSEYGEAIHAYAAHPVHQQRQQLLKSKVREILAAQFSVDELAAANINYDADWKLNIIDHHGILNHPILLSTNVIANINAIPTAAPAKPEGVIVLSDSGVPLNNFFHKRGLKFHGTQLNIIPSRDRHIMAYAAAKRESFPLVAAAQKSDITDQKQLEHLQRMELILHETANHPRVTNYRQQVTRTNYILWKELWEKSMRPQIPDLLYVANEDLGVALLNEYLQDPSHLFSRILFDASVRDIILREFNNVTGCWDMPGMRGTVFFWGVDTHGRAVRMTLNTDGTALIPDSADKNAESFLGEIPLTPEGVCEAMNQERIYPGMFLVYGLANFYCGVRPLVGFASMNYQTRMKEAWIRALEEIAPEEVEYIQTINTYGFIGGPKVTFGYDQEQGFQEMFALDIIAQGGYTHEYLAHLKQMALADILRPALPDIYDSYVRPERKQEITVSGKDFMGESFEWLKTVK